VSRLPQRFSKKKETRKKRTGSGEVQEVEELHKFHRDPTRNWRLIDRVVRVACFWKQTTDKASPLG
jgi:hypothetical protein